MTFPVLAVSMPASLTHQANGKIDAALLEPCGLRSFVLLNTAVDPFGALRWAASQDGITLDATGTYRTYGQQVTLFESRYTRDRTKAALSQDGRPVDARRYEGETWYRLPGVASAAVPGTSNHGWGLAVDFAEQRDTDPEPESLSTATLNWLLANALDFGWSWELQSEPWHLRFVAGDHVPFAVQEWINAGRPVPGALPPPVVVPPPVEEVTLKDMPTLKLGAQGNAVVTMQSLLIQRGTWTDQPQNRDGIFGNGTDAGVRKFQTARGLTVDGICGPKTWAALGHA